MLIQRRRDFLITTSAAIALSRTSLAATPDDPAVQRTIKLNAWLEERFNNWTERSPMFQSYLGLKTNLDKWDDISQARQKQDADLAARELAELNANFKPEQLTEDGNLSHRLYAFEMQKRLDDYRWRLHEYPVNQMFGWQQEIPSFLINIHRVGDRAEAEAYIARLRNVPEVMAGVLEAMRAGEKAGVLPPKFVLEHVIRDTRNVITGAPFGGAAKDSTLLEDIKSKVNALKIADGDKQKLLADAEAALRTRVQPALNDLIKLCEEQHARATTDDGAWKHPDGAAYYAHKLKYHTTTSMTADQIHEFGLSEVARIHGEMREIMKKVRFSGDLQAFFRFMKEEPKFYFPQTDEGKAAYLKGAMEIVDRMRARLDDVFLTKPKAELTVKQVEPFREQSTAQAFYQQPGAFDGRPGIYYVNTYDMKTAGKYEMEALAFHEGIPGHHMQIAIAQELEEVAKFRKFWGNYTAYIEGWGLYCELLPKEMGFYTDPYSDFGRLSMELWRAARLVVDTGIHSGNRKWTREQTVKYLQDNTPNAETDTRNETDRYIVMPGQATAYKIGMTKILELREAAKTRLGPKFDIREYHDVVLTKGALPLNILEENVEAWVRSKA